jgi:hypothetical protein
MLLEIDISGQDILNEDFAVAIANKNLIYGYKIKGNLVNRIIQDYNSGKYRYKGKKGKKNFKIRFYSLIIYCLFKNIIRDKPKIKKEKIQLAICNDFDGHENDIKSNLTLLLKDKLKLEIDSFKFGKLPQDSIADRYAYLFRKDTRRQLPNSIKIILKEIEKFLIKK